MALWMVRAGSHGEGENVALDKNVAVVGWHDLPDLRDLSSRESLERLYRRTYPDVQGNAVRNHVGQIWAFIDRIRTGDIVVLPLKSRSAIAFGEVTGPYEHRPDLSIDARHTRPVRWLRVDVPRAGVDQDLLYSFGAFMTVCQIQRNNAEARVRALLQGGHTPPANGQVQEPATDLEEYARDQIRGYISRKFRGHDLARLVECLLSAQGYHAERSPAGPDGGVDIMAGGGPMGFDPPRLCVQVKSSDSPVDVNAVRELRGVMRDFGASQGLMVSWGGYRGTVIQESRRQFFEIRLWDADDLVDGLLSHYEQLPDDLQAELPLKRVWALVLEE